MNTKTNVCFVKMYVLKKNLQFTEIADNFSVIIVFCENIFWRNVYRNKQVRRSLLYSIIFLNFPKIYSVVKKSHMNIFTYIVFHVVRLADGLKAFDL